MDGVDIKESHTLSSADPAAEVSAEAATTPALKMWSSIKESHSRLWEPRFTGRRTCYFDGCANMNRSQPGRRRRKRSIWKQEEGVGGGYRTGDTKDPHWSRRRFNRPVVSITLMRSYLPRKSLLSGFRSRRIVVCKEENVGTRATRCSSRVFGLVEARRLTNTWFSRLEVACFREKFGRSNSRHGEGLPWDAQDGIVRGRSRKEPAPPPPVLVGENTQKHNPDLPDSRPRRQTVWRVPKTCPRPACLPTRKGSRLENRLRPQCTDNMSEVFYCTQDRADAHMRCQFWGRETGWIQ